VNVGHCDDVGMVVAEEREGAKACVVMVQVVKRMARADFNVLIFLDV
jgi:hypothetical protein